MMALTAEQHSQLAIAYEKAAADRMVPAEQREAFSRKAHWFRIQARIAEKNEARRGRQAPLPARSPAAPSSLALSNIRKG
jgi:hypothetical protein